MDEECTEDPAGGSGFKAALALGTVLLAALLVRARSKYASVELHATGPLPNPSSRLARLSRGQVHYILEGPEDSEGAVVCLVHGFTGSHSYMKFLASELTKQGRRVLRFDLYGRGWSSCDGSPHTAKLFAGQLAELLYALDLHPPVHLVGYRWVVEQTRTIVTTA